MSESPPPPPSWSIASMTNSAVQFMRLPMLASSGLAVVASGLLYFKQNELIYPRNIPADARTNVPKPRQFGIEDYEELQLRTPDGESLHAYFIRAPRKRVDQNLTVLMFHGNAGNVGHRIPIAKIMQDYLGCHVLMLEYRGYGLSTGVPDENGLKIDAQTALDHLRLRGETANSRIVVYGQSLGGAVAINLVANNEDKGSISGLILENTFLSIRKLIPRHVPSSISAFAICTMITISSVFPPARYLARFCHQTWTSEEVLPKITKTPILFLSGLQDEIVPPSNMTQLFAICNSKRKVWRTLPNGAHNDSVAEPDYFEHIHSFVTEEVLKHN